MSILWHPFCIPAETIPNNNNLELVELDLAISLNPSSHVFNRSKETEWSVFNSLGVKIGEGTTRNIDLSNNPSGVYFLQLSGGGSHKLIKR